MRPRHLLFALLPALVLFALVELVLALLGVEGRGLSRGFDPTASYLAPDPDREGAWVTQMHDGERPETRIPPRDGRRRVLLFGGSNTAAFPPGFLQAELDRRRAPGSPAHEVINLGRAGYGSERVAILFQQALDLLEPDVVVIYSGHNEFVEAGFRAELGERLEGPKGALIEAAGHLLLFHALCDLLRPEEGARGERPRPEQWQWEFDRFAEYTFEQTRAHLERYRINLERMLNAGRRRGVEVVIGTVVSNPLVPPFANNVPAGQAAALERCVAENALALAQVPADLAVLFSDKPEDRLHVNDWRRAARPQLADRTPAVLRPYGGGWEGNLALAPDPTRWSDRVWRILPAWERFHARDLSAEERAAIERAHGHLEAALRHVPDHPLTHFRLGLTSYLLGDASAALEFFDEAARLDRAPRKGNRITNGTVRALAAERPWVRLFDAERLVRERAPGGLIGFELMEDECHLHDRAVERLMVDLAAFLSEPAEAR